MHPARLVTAGLAVAGMIATPLAPRGGRTRCALANLVVTAAAATTTLSAATRWGWRRSAAATGAIVTTTAVIERVGSTTGLPFGRYRYSGRLRPAVGGVPAIVPLAWWAMALPAREAAHAALGPSSTPARRVVVGSAALTAWDLFLDPQMTAEGYWQWERDGRYRGIPASNYGGWLIVGAGVMALLERLLPPAAPVSALIAELAVTAAMETIGFLFFFRDPVVAAVGAIGMLPIAVAGLVRGG